jgi:conjugal transfer ATP-binding protein TraC
VQWLRDYSGDESNRAQDLAMQLEPFSHGRYRRWFSGPRTVTFSKPLVVIELEELKQDSALQAVVLQLVMFQVTKEMYLGDRRLPKLLAIDEAWDLMGGLKTGRFIETAFRRMRKYNGIAGVITQSFEDFEKSSAARAAIENAAWQFILYQRPESVEFAVSNKRISADEMSVSLIKSVRSGAGFSEVFVRGEQGSGLYRFVTDKHSYYTFTTKPTDINRLDDLVRNGMTMEKAIDTLSMQDYEQMWGEKSNS